MRDVKLTIQQTKSQIGVLKGTAVRLKVNRGRNKIEMLCGTIEDAYPSIFTLRTDAGDIQTFSYQDVVTKNVTFYRAKQ